LHERVRSLESQLSDWSVQCATLERRLTHALDELHNLTQREATADEAEANDNHELRAELMRERDRCSNYEVKLQLLEDKLTKLRESSQGERRGHF